MKIIGTLRTNQTGASAVEFALIIPVFIVMLMGGFYTAFAAFTVSNMNHAVEAGARCASVNKTVCSSATATVAFTQTRFLALGTTPTFVASTAACGQKVTGTVNFLLETGISKLNMPLSAQACYP
jgi:Flp pilus assembly protein TadG